MKNTLGLVFFPAFDWMISPTHPERQERLLYTRDQLEEEGLFDCEEIKEYRPRLAQINDLQRAHIGVLFFRSDCQLPFRLLKYALKVHCQ